MPSRTLIVFEADGAAQRGLVSYLGSRGFLVRQAQTAVDFWRRVSRQGADAIVVQLALLADSPLDALRRVRVLTPAPVIAIDTSHDSLDRILALELGADDYLTTPYQPREVLARLRSIERRAELARSGACSEYVLLGGRFRVAARCFEHPDGTRHALSSTECAVLHALVRSPRTLLTRSRLWAATHRDADSAGERSVDVTIARLRRKLGDLRAAIATERGGGYRLDCAVHVETVLPGERRSRVRAGSPLSGSAAGDELAEGGTVEDRLARGASVEVD